MIQFHTNDAWALVSAMSDKVGYPLLLMDRYAQGAIYVWTMPDNPHHLCNLPVEVTTAIKDVVMQGFFVRIDEPSQVALHAYDNNTFIVESYLPTAVGVKISLTDGAMKIRNVVTGAVIDGRPVGEIRKKSDAHRSTRASRRTATRSSRSRSRECCLSVRVSVRLLTRPRGPTNPGSCE
jgi:hypothetical protein